MRNIAFLICVLFVSGTVYAAEQDSAMESLAVAKIAGSCGILILSLHFKNLRKCQEVMNLLQGSGQQKRPDEA